MECRPVRTFSELCAAFTMVHDNYVASGYMTPHSSGMRYTALQLLPVSTTWIAIYGNEIIGTGTVVAYSPAGLPFECCICGPLQDAAKQGPHSRRSDAPCLSFPQ